MAPKNRISTSLSPIVSDQDFHNPTGTGFTALLNEIWPDYPVSFCRII